MITTFSRLDNLLDNDVLKQIIDLRASYNRLYDVFYNISEVLTETQSKAYRPVLARYIERFLYTLDNYKKATPKTSTNEPVDKSKSAAYRL